MMHGSKFWIIVASTAFCLFMWLLAIFRYAPDCELDNTLPQTDTIATVELSAIPAVPENSVLPYGLVRIRDIAPEVAICLKYSGTDNFTGQKLYDSVWDAFLQPDVAEMLSEADRHLRRLHPELRLLVYDAARPVSVQRKMWEQVKDTPYRNYVANPERTGLHNYGAAVDITLTDSVLTPLDMGTIFDYFGEAAGISREEELLRRGILTARQVDNRQLLREVMRHAGFLSVSGEWWHFNACPLGEAKQRYPLIE
ncbi:MAG: M15 family metallopeptidase [Bacteroidales bacterium]|jgi:D-alanyl-D-alanine dipeptidase|nr:M15 family metallopeptidase [Bacteroidales bacterium]